VLRTVLSEHTAKLLQVLEALRNQLENVLTQARECVSGTEIDPLPKASGLPLFDVTNLIERTEFGAPRLGRLLGVPWLRYYARGQVKEQLGFLLADFLDTHRLRLRPWLRQALTELRAAFHARAGLVRIQLEAESAMTTVPETDAARMEVDLRCLRNWAARPPP